MARVLIEMAREPDLRARTRDGGESTLRPRPLTFHVFDPEQIERLSRADQDQLDQYARNLIASYLRGQQPSIDASVPADYIVERVTFEP